MTDYQQVRNAITTAKVRKLAHTKTAVGKRLFDMGKKTLQAIRRNPGKSTAIGAGAAATGAGALAAPGLIDKGQEVASDAWESAKDAGREIQLKVEESAPEVAERIRDTANAATGGSAEAKIRETKRAIKSQLQYHKGQAGDAWQYTKDRAGDAWQYAKDNPGRVAGGAALGAGAAGLLYWLLKRRQGQSKKAQVLERAQRLVKRSQALPDNQQTNPSPALQQFRRQLHQAQGGRQQREQPPFQTDKLVGTAMGAAGQQASRQPDLAPAEVGKPGAPQPSTNMGGATAHKTQPSSAQHVSAYPY